VVTAPIRIGVQLDPQHADYAMIRHACRAVEEAGADIVFNWDHFWPLSGDKAGKHFECWTMLGAWAETTTRIEFGPLVSSIGYRNPDLLADMARTLDHVSGGRFVLGVGSGFRKAEYDEYGLAFGTPGERVRQLDDGLARIERRLGLLAPPPTRKIPILVAGGGEQKTLAVVARHADIWNTFAEGEDYVRKSRILDQHCAAIGRDPAEIERSVLVAGDPEAVGEPLFAHGVRLFVLGVDSPYHLGEVERWIAWRDSH
jgi:probable F420-dependent oxidoreductase